MKIMLCSKLEGTLSLLYAYHILGVKGFHRYLLGVKVNTVKLIGGRRFFGSQEQPRYRNIFQMDSQTFTVSATTSMQISCIFDTQKLWQLILYPCSVCLRKSYSWWPSFRSWLCGHLGYPSFYTGIIATLVAHCYMLRIYNLSLTCEIGNKHGVILCCVLIT